MTERVPPSALYRGARERLDALVRGRPEVDGVPVPATPGWTVHDVVAHLVGLAEDLVAGWRPATAAPVDAWTAEHVARGKQVPTDVLLDRWSALSAQVESVLDEERVLPPALDAGTHEHDVRAALGDTAARDSDVVRVGASVLLKVLRPPVPLVVETELGEVRVGPPAAEDGSPPLRLRTTAFEAFRWRMGRRSPAQLAAMDWSGDPAPVLDALCLFGPAEHDVLEPAP